jgi:hypothetical protein
MVIVLAGGWYSQRLMTQGASSRLARAVFPCLTMAIGGCITPFIALVSQPELKVAILVVGPAIGSTTFIIIPMIVSELTPQPQRAAMLAIVNSIITLGGVAAPLIMGSVVQAAATRLAGYDRGFVILGGLLIAGSVIGMVFIRPEADRQWLARNAIARPVQASRP